MFLFQKKCPKEISDLVERYLLNHLSDGDSRSLEEHLLNCPQCMDVFEETEQFLSASRETQARKSRTLFSQALPPMRPPEAGTPKPEHMVIPRSIVYYS